MKHPKLRMKHPGARMKHPNIQSPEDTQRPWSAAAGRIGAQRALATTSAPAQARSAPARSAPAEAPHGRLPTTAAVRLPDWHFGMLHPSLGISWPSEVLGQIILPVTSQLPATVYKVDPRGAVSVKV